MKLSATALAEISSDLPAGSPDDTKGAYVDAYTTALNDLKANYPDATGDDATVIQWLQIAIQVNSGDPTPDAMAVRINNQVAELMLNETVITPFSGVEQLSSNTVAHAFFAGIGGDGTVQTGDQIASIDATAGLGVLGLSGSPGAWAGAVPDWAASALAQVLQRSTSMPTKFDNVQPDGRWQNNPDGLPAPDLEMGPDGQPRDQYTERDLAILASNPITLVALDAVVKNLISVGQALQVGYKPPPRWPRGLTGNAMTKAIHELAQRVQKGTITVPDELKEKYKYVYELEHAAETHQREDVSKRQCGQDVQERWTVFYHSVESDIKKSPEEESAIFSPR